MADARVQVDILNVEEMRAVVAVARAAVDFMRWAAPVSMDATQWDAWSRLEAAVSKMGETVELREIPPQ